MPHFPNRVGGWDGDPDSRMLLQGICHSLNYVLRHPRAGGIMEDEVCVFIIVKVCGNGVKGGEIPLATALEYMGQFSPAVLFSNMLHVGFPFRVDNNGNFMYCRGIVECLDSVFNDAFAFEWEKLLGHVGPHAGAGASGEDDGDVGSHDISSFAPDGRKVHVI